MSLVSQPIESRSEDINRISLDVSSNSVEVELIAYAFADNGYIVNYIPSLNLSAYGLTQQEANTMLIDIVLDDYVDNLIELPLDRITHELNRLGWSAINSDAGGFEHASPIQLAFFNPSTYLKPIEPLSYCIHKQFARIQVPL